MQMSEHLSLFNVFMILTPNTNEWIDSMHDMNFPFVQGFQWWPINFVKGHCLQIAQPLLIHLYVQ